jgi:conserved oligomeric Golgi complex subunit 3
MQGIDQELKRACEDIIVHLSNIPCGPLREWCSRVRVLTATSQGSALAKQPWATPQSVSALSSSFREACERELLNAAVRLRLYIEDERTAGVLLGHTRDKVLADYAEYLRIAQMHYSNVDVMSEEEATSLLRRCTSDDTRGEGSSTRVA